MVGIDHMMSLDSLIYKVNRFFWSRLVRENIVSPADDDVVFMSEFEGQDRRLVLALCTYLRSWCDTLNSVLAKDEWVALYLHVVKHQILVWCGRLRLLLPKCNVIDQLLSLILQGNRHGILEWNSIPGHGSVLFFLHLSNFCTRWTKGCYHSIYTCLSYQAATDIEFRSFAFRPRFWILHRIHRSHVFLLG